MVIKKKSKCKIRSYKKSKKNASNYRIIKNLIAGVFSPVSASRKIQSVSRGRITRQTKKSEKLQSLLSQGAPIYKRALKTLDFTRISMKGQVLSRRVLDGAKFPKVDFTNAKLNGTKFYNVNAEGALFINAELKKTVSHNCNLKNCIYKKSVFNDFVATECNFSGCKFIDIQLHGTKPIELKSCTLNDIKLINTEVKFMSSLNLFAYINVSEIDNLEIISEITSGRYNFIKKIEHHMTKFNNLFIKNVTFRENAIFKDCVFNYLKLDNVQFFKTIFVDCVFNDCNFGEFIGHSNTHQHCRFYSCNLQKCDLRSNRFRDCTFSDCNLNLVKFEYKRSYSFKK